MNPVQLNIEALVFVSDQSISVSDIRLTLQAAGYESITNEEISVHLETIREKYSSVDYAFALVELNGGFQFLTKKEYHSLINLLQLQKSKKKLSQAALETLSIIAYKQPITKLEIEQIRGVNCDYSIQRLLEKELIAIAGKAETIGKPLLYCTSTLFMDYFGIKSSAELPHLKDFASGENSIGEKSE